MHTTELVVTKAPIKALKACDLAVIVTSTQFEIVVIVHLNLSAVPKDIIRPGA